MVELRPALRERGIENTASMSWGLGVDALFEVSCAGQLVQPTFVLDQPRETSPLTKVKRGDPRLTERF